MAEERRFPTEFRETETDEPGLVLTDAGDVEVVLPGGSRETVGTANGGSQTVFQHTATLDDDAIKSLPTAPGNGVEVVPPVGSGKVAIFLQCALQTVGFDANPYANVNVDALLALRQGVVGIASDIFNIAATNPPEAVLTDFFDQSNASPPADVAFLLPTFVYSNDWGGAFPYLVNSGQTDNAAFSLYMNNADSVGPLTGGDPGNKLAVTTVYALFDLIS